MATELTVLAWSVVLGLFQVILAAQFLTAAAGAAYGMGPRDEPPPRKPGVIGGRAERASKNFIETFPFFAAAVLAAAVSNRFDTYTWWGAQLYIWARVAFLPLYLLGIPVVRTLVYLVSVGGILLVLIGLAWA